MITIEVLEAIKNKETVQFKNAGSNDWSDIDLANILSNYFIMGDWRIKPKPYKKEHLFFLSLCPENTNPNSIRLDEVLFGDSIASKNYTSHFNKKFKVTVEEVVE